MMLSFWDDEDEQRLAPKAGANATPMSGYESPIGGANALKFMGDFGSIGTRTGTDAPAAPAWQRTQWPVSDNGPPATTGGSSYWQTLVGGLGSAARNQDYGTTYVGRNLGAIAGAILGKPDEPAAAPPPPVTAPPPNSAPLPVAQSAAKNNVTPIPGYGLNADIGVNPFPNIPQYANPSQEDPRVSRMIDRMNTESALNLLIAQQQRHEQGYGPPPSPFVAGILGHRLDMMDRERAAELASQTELQRAQIGANAALGRQAPQDFKALSAAPANLFETEIDNMVKRKEIDPDKAMQIKVNNLLSHADTGTATTQKTGLGTGEFYKTLAQKYANSSVPIDELRKALIAKGITPEALGTTAPNAILPRFSSAYWTPGLTDKERIAKYVQSNGADPSIVSAWNLINRLSGQ